jgi:hypothetical protein
MNLYEEQKYTKKKDEEMYRKMANKSNAVMGRENDMKITKKNTCISPEKEYEGFVTRREFINRTGVFVSAVNFENIYEKFKELSVSADEFVRDYIDKYSDFIISDRNNLVHFEINDDEVSAVGCYANSVESDELNVLDLLYNLSESVEYYRDKLIEVRKQAKDLCNAVKSMGK